MLDPLVQLLAPNHKRDAQRPSCFESLRIPAIANSTPTVHSEVDMKWTFRDVRLGPEPELATSFITPRPTRMRYCRTSVRDVSFGSFASVLPCPAHIRLGGNIGNRGATFRVLAEA